MIVATSLAFNTMMFLMMVRVEDPLVPRAMFGILNTLLFFPSGAIYPIKAFPAWLRAIAYVDPFTYAVHGFKAMLLKDAGFVAIRMDLAVPDRRGRGDDYDRDAAVQADAVAASYSSRCTVFMSNAGRQTAMYSAPSGPGVEYCTHSPA